MPSDVARRRDFWDMTASIVIIFGIWYLLMGMAISCHYIDRWDDYKVLKRCIVTPLWLPIYVIAFIWGVFYVFFKG